MKVNLESKHASNCFSHDAAFLERSWRRCIFSIVSQVGACWASLYRYKTASFSDAELKLLLNDSSALHSIAKETEALRYMESLQTRVSTENLLLASSIFFDFSVRFLNSPRKKLGGEAILGRTDEANSWVIGRGEAPVQSTPCVVRKRREKCMQTSVIRPSSDPLSSNLAQPDWFKPYKRARKV